MDEKTIFPLFRQISNSLSEYYNDIVEQEMQKSGLGAEDFYRGVLRAKTFDPDPISAQCLSVRSPYATPVYYNKVLSNLKNSGIFEDAVEGGYLLTQQGHILFRRVIGEIYQQMELANPLRLPELEEIKYLLARIVQASLLSPDQPRKWAI